MMLSTPPSSASSDATPKSSRSTPLSPASVLDTPSSDAGSGIGEADSPTFQTPPSACLQPQELLLGADQAQTSKAMTLPSLRHQDSKSCEDEAAVPSSSKPLSSKPSQASHLLKQQQPFFLLGWLEDLVPEDPDAFAEALKTAQSFKKKHQQSPLQRFFSRFSRSDDFKPRRGSASMPDLRRPLSLQRDVSDVSAKSTPLQMQPPSTPKSSNRRSRARLQDHDDMIEPLRLDFESTTAMSTEAHQRWQERRKVRNAQKANCSVLQRSLLQAKQWNSRGLEHVNAGDFHAALECWNNALEIYQGLHLQSHTANVQNNRGIVLGKLGRVKEAMEALTTALELRSDNPSAIASTLHNMANVQQEAGDFGQALELLAQAKEMLWEDDDDIPPSNTPKFHQSARLCTAMGHVYAEAEHFIDASEAYWDALQVYERLVKLPAVDDRKVLLQELQGVRNDLEDLENRMALQEFSNDEEEHKHDDLLGRFSYQEDDGYAPWYYGNSAVDTPKTTSSASPSWRQILPTR